MMLCKPSVLGSSIGRNPVIHHMTKLRRDLSDINLASLAYQPRISFRPTPMSTLPQELLLQRLLAILKARRDQLLKIAALRSLLKRIGPVAHGTKITAVRVRGKPPHFLLKF